MNNEQENMSNSMLLDEPLVGEPNENFELYVEESRTLSDDEIRGARLQILCQSVERVDGGTAVALDLFFQPPDAARFTYARITLKLLKPEAALFYDVAPLEIVDSRPVEFTVENKGLPKLTVTYKAVEAGVEAGKTYGKKYTSYECLVSGTGVSTQFADWRFSENSNIKDGLIRNARVAVILPEDGPFEIELTKPGLAGALDRMRTLVFGPSYDKTPTRKVIIEVPEESGGWFFI